MKQLVAATSIVFFLFLALYDVATSALLSLGGFLVVLLWELKAGRITVALTRKARAQELLRSVTAEYHSLKSTHPDLTEHQRLANTWLRRYQPASWFGRSYSLPAGTTVAELRVHDPERLRHVAFTETMPFALFDPPNSIRGLAYYLLYRELPGEVHGWAEEYQASLRPAMESLHLLGYHNRRKRVEKVSMRA